MPPSASQIPAYWRPSDGIQQVPNAPKTPKYSRSPEDARAVLEQCPKLLDRQSGLVDDRLQGLHVERHAAMVRDCHVPAPCSHADIGGGFHGSTRRTSRPA